jgi:hypothetical protein
MKTELKQFFDVIIRIQKKGYSIFKVTSDEYENYFVMFAFSDVCRGFAFGGHYYHLTFNKNMEVGYLERSVMDKVDVIECRGLEECISYIENEIDELERAHQKEERQRILTKLTSIERKILGLEE